jgi:hypothetical protein
MRTASRWSPFVRPGHTTPRTTTHTSAHPTSPARSAFGGPWPRAMVCSQLQPSSASRTNTHRRGLSSPGPNCMNPSLSGSAKVGSESVLLHRTLPFVRPLLLLYRSSRHRAKKPSPSLPLRIVRRQPRAVRIANSTLHRRYLLETVRVHWVGVILQPELGRAPGAQDFLYDVDSLAPLVRGAYMPYRLFFF